MNTRQNQVFTAANIVAVLQAAPEGGTSEEVIKRAGVNVSQASLDKWIKEGRRDLKNNKQSAYRLFAEQWDTVYPGAPPRNEAARMSEMHKALEVLGIQVPKTCPASIAANGSRPKQSKTTCECGNAKNPDQTCCDTCTSMDRSRAAA